MENIISRNLFLQIIYYLCLFLVLIGLENTISYNLSLQIMSFCFLAFFIGLFIYALNLKEMENIISRNLFYQIILYFLAAGFLFGIVSNLTNPAGTWRERRRRRREEARKQRGQPDDHPVWGYLLVGGSITLLLYLFFYRKIHIQI
jgi:hypothetical protein